MQYSYFFIKFTVCLLVFSTSVNGKEIQNEKTCSPGESCIPHYECKAVTNLTSKGSLTPVERAQLKTKLCNIVERVYHFCCTSEKSSVDSLNNRISSHLPTAPNCGIYFQDKITRGTNTFIDEYPWFALIQYSKPNNQIGHHCGGSLINKRFVLTAAHCHTRVRRTWKLSKVRLGEWDQRTNPDCEVIDNEKICNEKYVDVPVVEVIIHPKYYSFGAAQYNDIALLKLENDVEYSAWIKPICLPIDPEVRNMDFTSHSLEVTGFGLTENGTSSPVMQRVNLDGIPLDECQKAYNAKGVNITDNQICFGSKDGRDSCNGDSGGPLMKYGKFPHSKYAHFMQIGLVSFGPKYCGNSDYPGVYTRIADYMDWIIENTQLD